MFVFAAKSEVVSEASQPASVKGKEETLKRAKLLEGLSPLSTYCFRYFQVS